MLRALEERSGLALTENGAVTNRSSGSCCLDFFAVCGALRNAPDDVVIRLFVRAFAQDRDLALRILFYARDVRGGLGERALFRRILSWLARYRPDTVRKNISLIPEYGRWDDLLSLLGTACGTDAVVLIRDRLREDLRAARDGGRISLLAKWLPSVNTSSASARAAAGRLCREMGMSQKTYRRILSFLRARLDLTETRLCRRDYTFDYAAQPSGAMFKYRRAFERNDGPRYSAFIGRVMNGEEKMHAGTLYPYQIIRSCLHFLRGNTGEAVPDNEAVRSLDASWRALPDWGDGRNALAVIDGSGSMYTRSSPSPAEIAMSLGIYFAEHNTGRFRDHFITFSHTPRLIKLRGDNIVDRTAYCMSYNEASNTDLRAVFTLLLDTAVENRLPQEDMPRTVYIISDMEFDQGTRKDETLFREIRDLFASEGYRLPSLVYWNVSCRHEQFPVRMDENGTVLASGASPALFRMMIGQNATPEEFMHTVLDSKRYLGISA